MHTKRDRWDTHKKKRRERNCCGELDLLLYLLLLSTYLIYSRHRLFFFFHPPACIFAFEICLLCPSGILPFVSLLPPCSQPRKIARSHNKPYSSRTYNNKHNIKVLRWLPRYSVPPPPTGYRSKGTRPPKQQGTDCATRHLYTCCVHPYCDWCAGRQARILGTTSVLCLSPDPNIHVHVGDETTYQSWQ